MAGKGSRKSQKASKKDPIDVETFACDVLSYILPLCGFPNQNLKCQERKQNAYSESFVVRTCALILKLAMSKRDEWKTMFESRFKNSGLDTPEKIDKYLKSLLAISQEFRNGDTATKIHLSLAAYSEIMLFLNYNDVEIDFEQMLILWSRYFKEVIAQNLNASELLKSTFTLIKDPTQFTKWITNFVEDVASPYGYRDDVSEVLSLRLDRRKRFLEEKDVELAESLAKLVIKTKKDSDEPPPVLPPGFESSAVLPGDRESPEPPETFESGVRRKEKGSRRRSFRSTGVSNPGFEGRQATKEAVEPAPILPPGFESSAVLPGDRESPEPPETFKSGVRRKEKGSRRRSFRSTGVSNPVFEGRQATKEAEEPAPILPPGFESSAVLPGDRESPEPPETFESGVRRKEKGSRRRSFRSTGVSNPGFEGRQRRKTASELELEERLGLMNLSSEDSHKKNKQKRRKPKDRESY